MINARVKAMFFDRPEVIRAVDRGTRSVLSKFGAFVRQRAKTSMRYAKGKSAPGTPPHAHEKPYIRSLTFHVFEPLTRNVVIGPLELEYGEHMAQELNEKGGAIARRRKGARRTYIYPPRPYMLPAFNEEKKNLPVLWANSIK